MKRKRNEIAGRQTEMKLYTATALFRTRAHQTSMSARVFYAISAFVDYAANVCWGFSLVFAAAA